MPSFYFLHFICRQIGVIFLCYDALYIQTSLIILLCFLRRQVSENLVTSVFTLYVFYVCLCVCLSVVTVQISSFNLTSWGGSILEDMIIISIYAISPCHEAPCCHSFTLKDFLYLLGWYSGFSPVASFSSQSVACVKARMKKKLDWSSCSGFRFPSVATFAIDA